MSIAVRLPELATAMADYRFAYLLTVGDGASPHAVAIVPTLVEGRLVLAGLGERTRANASARPTVSLVWPPADVDGYSLIVDGEAEVREETLEVTPARAVLHRPAPASGPVAEGACSSDCVPLPVTD